MSLCSQCGNVLVHGCGPVCLVCQHTGRVTATEVKQSVHDAILEHTSSALDAVYAALTTVHKPEDKLTPQERFVEAQVRLRHRVRFPGHNRERPDWEAEDEEQRERRPVCQSCRGTGQWLAFPCPDCSEDGDAERD